MDFCFLGLRRVNIEMPLLGVVLGEFFFLAGVLGWGWEGADLKGNFFL